MGYTGYKHYCSELIVNLNLFPIMDQLYFAMENETKNNYILTIFLPTFCSPQIMID